MILACLLTTCLLHPAHTTLAELRWNEASRCVEISLRLAQSDAEILRREASKTIPTELISMDDAAVSAIRRHVRFGDGAGQFKWIGQEDDGFHVWWHFEYHPSSSNRPGAIASTLLNHRRTQGTERAGHASHAMIQMIFAIIDRHADTEPSPNASIILDERTPSGRLPW